MIHRSAWVFVLFIVLFIFFHNIALSEDGSEVSTMTLYPHFEEFGTELSRDDMVMLDKAISELKKMPIKNIVVIGHTDSTGIRKRSRHIFADNYELSKGRARSVADYIANALSLSPEQVTVEGKGGGSPIASNKTKEGRAMNRRVELKIMTNKAKESSELKDIKEERDIKSVEVAKIEETGKEIEADKKDEVKTADLFEQGMKELKAGNYEEAVSSLKKAREQEPKSAASAYYLGLVYKAMQDYEDAAVHLKDATSLEPNIKEARLELAEAYYLLDMNEESLKELETAEREEVKPAYTAFLKGLVMMKLDKDKEAVDEFEKAKKLDATLAQAANYQIGIALIRQGNVEKAAMIFNEIIIMDPNSDLARFASQYREALARKAEIEKPLKFTLGASWQYDDNVILKPSDQAVANGISGEKDTAYIALLRAEYTTRVSAPLSVKAQYSAYYKNYQTLDAYDVMSSTIAVAPSYSLKESMLSMLSSYNYTWVDNDEYLKTETLSPSYSMIIGKNQMAQIGLRWQAKDFLKPPLSPDEDRDSEDMAASLGWFYFYGGNSEFINLNYEINKEETKGANWKYLGNKANINLSIPLKDKLKFNGSAEVYQQQFDNVNTNFLKRRMDRTYTVSALIAYELYENADIQLQYSYIRGDSNIAVYDYRKTISGIGIEVRF